MADKKVASPSSPRLKELYRSQILPAIMKELDIKNLHDAPKLEKIIVSVGIGKNKDDKRHHEVVVNTLRKITGQQPVDRMAKKSIAGFKIRAGMNRVGVSVTLRGIRMYEFLDRLVNVALPRVRDFHGIAAKAFDASGNYSLGITDQSIFPELNFEDTQVTHGLQVTFVISTKSPAHTRALLAGFGMPFEKEEKR
ncbi:MAG TPA: 50S ribosomal protein L5 [Candidatus Saccharimonadales bacterium]|jgi:large subunit ribosomal protein L5|nr:50S ribosomal protein L5 [Candidatus Saccharimonadales bacterium]